MSLLEPVGPPVRLEMVRLRWKQYRVLQVLPSSLGAVRRRIFRKLLLILPRVHASTLATTTTKTSTLASLTPSHHHPPLVTTFLPCSSPAGTLKIRMMPTGASRNATNFNLLHRTTRSTTGRQATLATSRPFPSEASIQNGRPNITRKAMGWVAFPTGARRNSETFCWPQIPTLSCLVGEEGEAMAVVGEEVEQPCRA